MTVLIAIPHYGVPEVLLTRAVKRALRQTHSDTVVLVAGDGQQPPLNIRHPRLVVGTFPTNRGAPCTQQAMLLGSPFRWYAPHGADDFTDPDHVSRLLATRSRAAGSSRVWWHEPRKPPQVLRSRRTWIEFGLFDTALLRSVGGYGAQEPCGQDSLLSLILLQTSGVRLTTHPTYHKVYRAESLTHDPRTRQGSPIREGVKARNRTVIAECERLGWAPAAIRGYREGLVPPDVRAELEDRVAMVQRWLA